MSVFRRRQYYVVQQQRSWAWLLGVLVAALVYAGLHALGVAALPAALLAVIFGAVGYTGRRLRRR